MKLLVLTEYFPHHESEGITGGVEARALHLLQEIAGRHEVEVLCSYQGPDQARRSRVAGISVTRVGPAHAYSNEGAVGSRFAFAAAAFWHGLRAAGFDLVEGHSYLAFPVAALLGLLRRRPAVATFHEMWSLREWVHHKGLLTGTLGSVWVRASRMLGFDRYVAVSGATSLQLTTQGVPPERVEIVHNGVALPLLDPAPLKIGRPSICMSARLVRSKRADLLLRAAALLKQRIPDLVVTIQGEGDERASLERLARELGLGESVSFVGRLPGFAEVLALRARHDMFCLPSDSEGFGMAIIEAMALGVPVVCTDIPVLREITDGGRGALLFRQGDADDLAEKLGALFSDPRLRETLAREARDQAARYQWPRLAGQLEQIYLDVLARKGKRPLLEKG